MRESACWRPNNIPRAGFGIDSVAGDRIVAITTLLEHRRLVARQFDVDGGPWPGDCAEFGRPAHQLYTVEQRHHRISRGDAHPNRGALCRRHGCTRRATGRHVAHPATNRATGRSVPAEQPAVPAPSAEPEPSPDAREAATPVTPAATAAAPTPDARTVSRTRHEFRRQRPNEPVRIGEFDIGEPAINGGRRGPRDPRVDDSTAHRDTSSGGVGGQHLFGRGGCSWDADGTKGAQCPVGTVERRIRPRVKCPGMGGAESSCLQEPANPGPLTGAGAVLAWVRRQPQQTQSSFGRMFPVAVSSEEPALAPDNVTVVGCDITPPTMQPTGVPGNWTIKFDDEFNGNH